jgi:hypothetical protein
MLTLLMSITLATTPAASFSPTHMNLLRIPAYVLEGIALHESSHALMGKAVGMEVAHFEPYPHYYRGHYYIGTTILTFDHASHKSLFLVNAAPMMVDLTLFNATDLVLTQVQADDAGMFLTCAFMAVPLVDFAYNVNNRSSHSDLTGIAKYGGVSKTGVQVVGNVFVAYGLWRVYKRLTQYGD